MTPAPPGILLLPRHREPWDHLQHAERRALQLYHQHFYLQHLEPLMLQVFFNTQQEAQSPITLIAKSVCEDHHIS